MSEPTIEESLLLSRTEERDLARQEVNACHQALRLEREKTKRLREALRDCEAILAALDELLESGALNPEIHDEVLNLRARIEALGSDG